MKSGLLLTLKQLIKLGVIKLKKKRRRRVYSTDKQSPFQKGMNPIDIAGMGPQRYKDFIYASNAPNPQANTDALRIRDENRDLQTRIMEQKNQQEIQKILLEDQQKQQEKILSEIEQSKKYVMGEIANAIWAEPIDEGYTDKDNVDVVKTEGSREFKSQKINEGYSQETEGLQPEEEGYTQETEGFQPEEEGYTNPPYVERRELRPSGTTFGRPELVAEQRSREGDVPLQIPTEKAPPFPSLTYQSELSPIALKENQPMSTQIPMRKKSTIKIKRQEPKSIMAAGGGGGSSMTDVEQKSEGISGLNFPNIPASKEPYILPSQISQINITNKKPTKEEISKLRQFYLLLGLNDEKVLSSNKRDDFVKPILQKLKYQYMDLGGMDQQILKEKNPRVIYQAIRTKQGY
jgi:hypothetical protein